MKKKLKKAKGGLLGGVNLGINFNQDINPAYGGTIGGVYPLDKAMDIMPVQYDFRSPNYLDDYTKALAMKKQADDTDDLFVKPTKIDYKDINGYTKAVEGSMFVGDALYDNVLKTQKALQEYAKFRTGKGFNTNEMRKHAEKNGINPDEYIAGFNKAYADWNNAKAEAVNFQNGLNARLKADNEQLVRNQEIDKANNNNIGAEGADAHWENMEYGMFGTDASKITPEYIRERQKQLIKRQRYVQKLATTQEQQNFFQKKIAEDGSAQGIQKGQFLHASQEETLVSASKINVLAKKAVDNAFGTKDIRDKFNADFIAQTLASRSNSTGMTGNDLMVSMMQNPEFRKAMAEDGLNAESFMSKNRGVNPVYNKNVQNYINKTNDATRNLITQYMADNKLDPNNPNSYNKAIDALMKEGKLNGTNAASYLEFGVGMQQKDDGNGNPLFKGKDGKEYSLKDAYECVDEKGNPVPCNIGTEENPKVNPAAKGSRLKEGYQPAFEIEQYKTVENWLERGVKNKMHEYALNELAPQQFLKTKRDETMHLPPQTNVHVNNGGGGGEPDATTPYMEELDNQAFLAVGNQPITIKQPDGSVKTLTFDGMMATKVGPDWKNGIGHYKRTLDELDKDPKKNVMFGIRTEQSEQNARTWSKLITKGNLNGDVYDANGNRVDLSKFREVMNAIKEGEPGYIMERTTGYAIKTNDGKWKPMIMDGTKKNHFMITAKTLFKGTEEGKLLEKQGIKEGNAEFEKKFANFFNTMLNDNKNVRRIDALTFHKEGAGNDKTYTFLPDMDASRIGTAFTNTIFEHNRGKINSIHNDYGRPLFDNARKTIYDRSKKDIDTPSFKEQSMVLTQLEKLINVEPVEETLTFANGINYK